MRTMLSPQRVYEANLDERPTWPVAFAVKELTADVEARIGELVRRAAG
jgi:hypothetical protein